MRKLSVLILVPILLFSVVALSEGETLYNGDFSVMASTKQLPAGWYYDAWDHEASGVYVETGESGENIVVIENRVDNDARICQRVAVEPETCYRFSVEIFTYDVYYGAGATISLLDSFSSSESLFETYEWKTVSLIGYTEKDQKEIILALRLGGYGSLSNGTAKFRNVTMEKLDEAPEGAGSFASFSNEGESKTLSDLGVDFGLTGIMFVSLVFAAIGTLIYSSIVKTPHPFEEKKPLPFMIALVIMALFIRILLSLVFVGHKTDIACFMGWANRMAEYGPSGFYSDGSFADYPPGYMYVLWLIGVIKNLLGLSYGSPAFVLLLKLPSIVAEFVTAFIVYKMAQRNKLTNRSSLALLLIMLFHPAFAFLSSAWGQIDSLLTLALIGVLYLFMNNKRIFAGLLYGVAILMKPQSLMIGPLLAIAYLLPQKNKKYWRTLFKAEAAVAGAVSLILILSIPFSNGQNFDWLLDKYFSTMTSYAYASIEAFNMAAFYGGNWTPISEVPFLFSYSTWGIIGIVLSVIGSCVIYIKGRKLIGKTSLYLSCAFLFAALFTMGPYMHERYLYPALPLLLICAIRIDDRRLYISFTWFSVTLLLNSLAAFYITDHQSARAQVYDSIVTTGSFMTVLGFAYLTHSIYKMLKMARRELTELKTELPKSDEAVKLSNIAINADMLSHNKKVWGEDQLFKKRDRIYCAALTVVYAACALFNLGTLTAPQSEFVSENLGDEVLVEFAGEQEIAEIWVFSGMAEGELNISAGEAGEVSFDESFDKMFRWEIMPIELKTSSLVMSTYSGSLRIREMAFFDPQGERVWPDGVSEQGLPLFDEPHTVPDMPSYLNGMYFDELYHARTAYEHLNGINPYEISHPPLGKVLIMVGIAIFGMNTLGWRIIGALFGIGMLPILYTFARRMFKKPELALLAATLFAFDFMHFTQTRIATIDVYAVFFIILMFYFMYKYYSMSFYDHGLKATMLPLGLAGLFFGLGAASKWICIYAGVGLAVILLLSLIQRYREYRAAMSTKDQALIQKYGGFKRNLIITLMACCVFYIIVPLAIYIASYAPYMMIENGYTFADVWMNQVYMYEYHSLLTATHSFQSSWNEWPFTLKPMWYYINSYTPEGTISTLTASGNPAVWWVCTLGTLGLIISSSYLKIIKPKSHKEPFLPILFIGIAANYLPWVLVDRCTFIYHFFATVPFIILCTVALLARLEQSRPNSKLVKSVKWVWLALCIVLFILMYPGISGFEIPVSYAKILEKLPGGGVFYGL